MFLTIITNISCCFFFRFYESDNSEVADEANVLPKKNLKIPTKSFEEISESSSDLDPTLICDNFSYSDNTLLLEIPSNHKTTISNKFNIKLEPSDVKIKFDNSQFNAKISCNDILIVWDEIIEDSENVKKKNGSIKGEFFYNEYGKKPRNFLIEGKINYFFDSKTSKYSKITGMMHSTLCIENKKIESDLIIDAELDVQYKNDSCTIEGEINLNFASK
ncbi:hypothetical protein HERIO_146 [Hepatospora eriocheir]|uniref:Uncharacterized protein n=1 Tax=Hepatospora eriocheir TaxID=1081669 RepID=A0A1X0QEF5_9MICR|nr:hypothetical protein HERIO_146 [Hepatospora eriocheir]